MTTECDCMSCKLEEKIGSLIQEATSKNMDRREVISHVCLGLTQEERDNPLSVLIICKWSDQPKNLVRVVCNNTLAKGEIDHVQERD